MKNKLLKFRKLITSLLLVILLVFGFFVFFDKDIQTAEATWWNDSWSYRKAIPVTHANGSALTDFQVKILDGVDLSALINDGKLQSDLGDIRFTDLTGTVLDYWIEDITATTSINAWVVSSSIEESDTIYFYYGNSSIADAQDGEAVFEFFDGFDAYSGWSGDTGDFTLDTIGSKTVLRINGSLAPGDIFKNVSVSGDYVVEVEMKNSNLGNSPHPGFIFSGTGNSDYEGAYIRSFSNEVVGTDETTFGTPLESQTIGIDFHTYKAIVESGVLTALYFDETQLAAFDNWDVVDSFTKIGLWHHSSGASGYYDSLRVRKHASSEPTTGTLASEEVGPGPIGYWSFNEGYGTTAHDESSSGNDGAISGATWKNEEECVSGKCLYFDGSDDVVSLEDDFIMTSEETISFWFRGVNLPAGSISIIMGESLDSDSFLSVSEKTNIRLKDNSGISDTLSFGDMENKWVHFVLQKNGGTYYMYKNGKLETSTVLSSFIVNTFGNGTDSDTYNFEGFLDEIKFYPYLRSADQIKQDYTAGLAGVKSSKGVAASFGSKSDKWMSDGLVGYWKMDESATTTGAIDSSGNGNDGTYVGNASTTGGKFGRGGEFDGVDDYIDISSFPISTFESDFSTSVWFYSDGFGSAYNDILGSGTSPSGSEVWVLRSNSSGSLIFRARNGSNDKSITVTNIINLNEWYHAVFSYQVDTGAFNLWLNGDLVMSENASSGGFNAGSLKISEDFSDRDWIGRIDEVRIYNRALSAKEMSDLYQWAPGPVLHLKMDEMSGTTAYDTSGNENNGTINGTPEWAMGKYGSAMEFVTQSSDSVTVAQSDSINNLDSLTLSAWVYNDGSDIYYDRIIAKENSGFNFYLHVSNTIYFSAERWGTDGQWSISVPYVNKWVNIAVTYDYSSLSNDPEFFVDGKKYTATETATPAGVLSLETDNIVIGNNDGYNRLFNGQIDDVRIYNYARTQKQILEDMNGGAPAGAFAYWPMDEGYGTTINDESDKNYNGTMVATVWKDEDECVSGSCLYFDGENGTTVNIPVLGDMDNYSYCTWMKANSLTNTDLDTRIQLMTRGGDLSFDNNGQLRFWVGTSGSFPTVFSTDNIEKNRWYHVCGIYNGVGVCPEIYINGEDKSNCTVPGSGVPVDISSTELKLGRESGSSFTGNFNGYLDEAKIYQFALTTEEIKKDYNAGKAGIKNNNNSSTVLGSKSSSWMSDGLVGYWKMDETATTSGAIDSSGNGNDLTYYNTASTTGGKFGRGGVFDGVDDYMYLSDAIMAGATELTYSFWMKRDPNDSGVGYILYGSCGYIYSSGSDGYLRFKTSGTNLYSSNIIDDTWSHVSATFDGENSKIYINGELEAQAKDTIGSCGTLTIARNSPTGGSVFGGELDEIRIYNRALSAKEVSDLYQWAPGPVLELKMDEMSGTTAYDTSGHGNDGTITGASWEPVGKIGSALEFGSGAYADVGNPGSLDFTTNDFTINAWIKTGVSGTNKGITGKRGASGGIGYELRINANDKLEFYIKDADDGGYFQRSSDSTTYTDNNWHYVEAVVDRSDSVSLYIDGKYDGGGDISTSNASLQNSYNLYIGSTMAANDSFPGLIDSVRIYNYARTPAQIAYDYNGGKPIAHYRFDECSGSVIHDESGNANHGTLNLGTTGTIATGTCASSSDSFWYNGVDGKIGASGSFDGGDDIILVSDNSIHEPSYVTVSAWLKPNNIGDDWIVSKQTGTYNDYNHGYIMRSEGDTEKYFYCRFGYGSGSINVQTPSTSSYLNVWSHVLCSYDGTDAKMYLNGELVDTSTIASTIDYTAVDVLSIAGHQNENRPFDGQIDEVKIFNYALTAEQVKNDYNGGAVKFGN